MGNFIFDTKMLETANIQALGKHKPILCLLCNNI